MNGSLGQHAKVLELRLAERRSVAGNDDELGLSGSQGLESRLLTKCCSSCRIVLDDF